MVQFDENFSNTRVKELRSLEEERSIQATAPKLGFLYVNLKDTLLNPEALSIIEEGVARRAGVAGFNINQRTLSLAVKNPSLPETRLLVEDLKRKRYQVVQYMCSDTSLEHAWARYKDVVGSTSEKQGTLTVSPEETARLTSIIKKKDDVVDQLKLVATSSSTRRISETLTLVFAGALALRASDIHIEPEEFVTRLRYRLDGVLHDIVDLDNYIYSRLMSRLKLLSGMVLNVKAEAQDGRFTFNSGDREIEVRTSVIPGAFGESIVMRILDPSVSSFRLENIDLNEHMRAVLKQQLKRPNGLIITTGPTGSGKTTALYAFLREVHDESKKIITIENPVEYKLEGVVHTQVDKDYTFAKGLRAILRQDPDVIMVGEIRDKEVAETAIHAAQTGHLVFSTLHTNSAVAGFTRLIDLGVNPHVLGSSINILVGQRLVRKLCEQCKVSCEASAEEVGFINNVMKSHPYPTPIPNPLILYRAGGCLSCGGTGFKGRVGVFEGLVMDDVVEEVVLRDPREIAILEAAKTQKIPNMLHDGIDKIIAGVTSLYELERVVEFPQPLNTQTKNTYPADSTVSKVQKGAAATDEDFSSHVV